MLKCKFHAIKNAAKLFQHDLPTATDFQKQLEIRDKRLDGPTQEAVSRSLSHSFGTAAQYYQAQTQVREEELQAREKELEVIEQEQEKRNTKLIVGEEDMTRKELGMKQKYEEL